MADTTPPAAPTPDLDKTVPGGRFLVNGVLVDSQGEPIDESTQDKDTNSPAKSK